MRRMDERGDIIPPRLGKLMLSPGESLSIVTPWEEIKWGG
jgi:hypothetical protein